MENCAEDAASIIDFIAPRRLDRREIVGLRRALGDLQLRRRRVEVLPELPPKTGLAGEILLGPVQRPAYDRTEQEGLVWLQSFDADIRISHVLELILRLKQLCNACPQTDASAKRDDLLRRARSVVAAARRRWCLANS